MSEIELGPIFVEAHQLSSICDCERSHNGLGLAGRECDCPAGQVEGWIEPPNPDKVAAHWLTRRNADAAPGYELGLADTRVLYVWNGRGAWVTGYYPGPQRNEPNLVCLHSNNGWRLDEASADQERLATVAVVKLERKK